eukprot:symbB.v1.2.025461.t1/scaffold2453.1/size78854/6
MHGMLDLLGCPTCPKFVRPQHQLPRLRSSSRVLRRTSARRVAASSPALRAEVIFCLLAVGCSSQHSWPKTRKAAASLFGNRRDSLARSLLAALQPTTAGSMPRTAAAILFEASKRFKDLSWWVLGPEFLQKSDHTEFGILRHLRRVADKEDLPGVDFHPQSDGPGGMQEAVFSFLQTLGDPQDSVVVLLDEAYDSLPVDGEFVSKVLPDACTFPARRVVFFLGCPRSVAKAQEAAIAWAAEKANWQILRFSLGWISEFTSKIVSRLKVWNACGKLLPVLGGLLCQERGTAKWRSPQSNLPQDGIQNCGIQVESSSTPCPVKESYCWPSPRKVDRFEAGIGPRLHFVVHVPLKLSEMKLTAWSSSHSLVARCCLAALWRAHGAYYRCMISFIFEDEAPSSPAGKAVVTVSRKFAGRFMGKAATEHDILVALCSAIGDAKTRPARKQKPGKWAVCVQHPEQDAWGDGILAYPKDTVVELMLWNQQVKCSEELSGRILSLAAADSGVDVLVVHLVNTSNQRPLCSKTMHAAFQPGLLAASSAEPWFKGIS